MNDEQLLRYSRHILLPQIDIDGQQALLDSHVLIVGLGGLGSPVALYLASSGVGELTLIDNDTVELSNLQRQIVHNEQSIDMPKVNSAQQSITALNSQTQVNPLQANADEKLLNAHIDDIDVVVDCTDNFATRFVLNRACRQAGKPLVSAAAIRMEAQLSVFDPRIDGAPCYRCLYDEQGELAESCAESGVLAPLLGMIGSMQAIETIKLLTGVGESLNGRLLMVDAMTMQIRTLRLQADPACPVCGNGN